MSDGREEREERRLRIEQQTRENREGRFDSKDLDSHGIDTNDAAWEPERVDS